jgi:hypothetical protein
MVVIQGLSEKEAHMIETTEAAGPRELPRSETWDQLTDEDRVFHLREPMDVRVSYEEGLWKARSDELTIASFGETPDEAMESFAADFGDCWDCIAMEHDSKLGNDALDLKRRLLGIVASVAS